MHIKGVISFLARGILLCTLRESYTIPCERSTSVPMKGGDVIPFKRVLLLPPIGTLLPLFLWHKGYTASPLGARLLSPSKGILLLPSRGCYYSL